MMELQIKPGAATDDAAEIKSIVATIEKDMETLDDAFKSTSSGMQLEWADEVRSNWEKYFNGDIPEAMAEMNTAAANLEAAVKAALEYSQQA